MPKPYPIPSKEELQKLYWKDQLSFRQIAEKFSVCHGTVRRWWKIHGLTSREMFDGMKIRWHQKALNGLQTERTQEERRLLALSIEWEGSIGVTRRKTGRYTASIQLQNTRLELLNYVMSLAKMGVISPMKPNLNQINHKPTWAWSLHNLFLLEKLTVELEPYLITKREQAQLVLNFCRLRIKNYHQPFGLEENKIYERLKILNHKGRIKT